MKKTWYLALACLLLVLAVWGTKKIWLKVFTEPAAILPLHLLMADGREQVCQSYLSPFDWRSREKNIDFLWGDDKARPSDIDYLLLTDPAHWQGYLKGNPNPQELLYTASQWSFWATAEAGRTVQLNSRDILALSASGEGLAKARQNPEVQKILAAYKSAPAADAAARPLPPPGPLSP